MQLTEYQYQLVLQLIKGKAKLKPLKRGFGLMHATKYKVIEDRLVRPLIDAGILRRKGQYYRVNTNAILD